MKAEISFDRNDQPSLEIQFDLKLIRSTRLWGDLTGSYGVHVRNYNGRVLTMGVFHRYYSIPWEFDLEWHIRLLKKIHEIYDYKEVLQQVLDLVLPVCDIEKERDDYRKPAGKLANKLMKKYSKTRPSWTNLPKYSDTHFFNYKDYIKMFTEINSHVRHDREPSMPEIEYIFYLFNSFDDDYALMLHYYWVSGLVFKRYNMQLLKEGLQNNSLPIDQAEPLPLTELENILRLSLTFMQEEERYDEVLALVKTNLPLIRCK